MTNRTFRVRVGDTFTPSFDQIEVVPQGCALCVLCFALAINDIVTAVPNEVSYSLYVDGFVLYLSGSTLSSTVRRMQLAINRVADSHGFRFSGEKSHAVLFRRTRRVFPEPSLTLYGCLPSMIREVRSLGIIFDERLTWVPYLKSLSFMSKSS